MNQFVCVRLVKANSLDLNLFQFDHDLTFAAFFLNADRTLYGRFGTRSDKKADDDISLAGFGQALQGALQLHAAYPQRREALKGKQPIPTERGIPEDYPMLKGKYKPNLDYEGQVARSCIHCHQLGEARRRLFRDQNQPLPDQVMFPWPMPEVVGLALDSREQATVAVVTPGSAAAQAGFARGDRILSLQGQPLISVADVQWILHQAGPEESLATVVARGQDRLNLTLHLNPGWRQQGDVSWRATTWDMRRMTTGGVLLVTLTQEEREASGLNKVDLALRCQHVGQYGEHATAKNAGFLKGDIVVSWDGRQSDLSETELIAWMMQKKMPGAKVPVTVLRGDRRLEFELEMK
jgi:hypothetical protein